MRSIQLVVAVSLLAATSVCWASSSFVVPTTTLAAQTNNNSSAANSFPTQSNGNLGAGNVSKVDVHSLLYSGTTTKVYAHLMVWFGQSNHMNVGYSSTDPNEVKSQIDDMVSRGIDGVIVDWYGPGNSMDQATQLVMQQAENHPGFTFAIMVDQGAIEWYSCSGCSPQQALISQLQYVEKTYFTSPAYMTEDGQPVVTNFGIDDSYSINWNAVNSALGTHPLFLFSNNSGFAQTLSNGSYSWVMPTTSDYGMSYLTSFYDTGMGYQDEQTVGATYKGFNDSLASWGSGRVMGQQCGQTWLQTFSKINSLYNSGKQLDDLQLVTWNDYEEATEIESGIDNCFSLSGSTSGNTLQWSISGSENTVDHYTVYISSDGQNLMELTDLATGNYSLNLCSYPVPNASYKMFVQAVGKPSMANRITSAIAYNSTCVTTAPPANPTIALTAAPSSLTIQAGQSGNFTVVAQSQSGAFNNAIALSCSGLPSGLSCAFSPASITPGSNSASSRLTISAAAVVASAIQRKTIPLYTACLLPVGFFGLAFGKKLPRGAGLKVLGMLAILSIGIIASSCGGAGGTPISQNSPVTSGSSSYAVTVVGSANSTAFSTTVNVIVQ